jgi:hypothetical protein
VDKPIIVNMSDKDQLLVVASSFRAKVEKLLVDEAERFEETGTDKHHSLQAMMWVMIEGAAVIAMSVDETVDRALEAQFPDGIGEEEELLSCFKVMRSNVLRIIDDVREDWLREIEEEKTEERDVSRWH